MSCYICLISIHIHQRIKMASTLKMPSLAFVPKVHSGPPFGVDVLLDAETYDNGDSEEPFENLKIS